MQRVNSTVVIIVGDQKRRILNGLTGMANVAVADESPERVPELVARASTPYVVHDVDPLTDVAAAWAGFFDGTAPTGTLEVAIEAAIAALRDGRAQLPDYYIVLDPDDLPTTQRHWWLGVLADAAPSRVVPAPSSVNAVRATLSRLPAGRWWPDPPDDWLRRLPNVVPDQAGLPTAVRLHHESDLSRSPSSAASTG